MQRRIWFEYPHMPRTERAKSGKICHSGRDVRCIVDGYLGLAVTSGSARPRRVVSEHRVMPIDSVTLSEADVRENARSAA
jgi:hypothetical protein